MPSASKPAGEDSPDSDLLQRRGGGAQHHRLRRAGDRPPRGQAGRVASLQPREGARPGQGIMPYFYRRTYFVFCATHALIVLQALPLT